MRFVRSPLRAAIFFAIMFGLKFAHADVVLMQSEPAGKVTALEAAKQLQAGKPVFECKKTVFSETGRQKPVKGSKPTFNVNPGKQDDKASDAMLGGKAIYVCKTKAWDASKGKFSTAE